MKILPPRAARPLRSLLSVFALLLLAGGAPALAQQTPLAYRTASATAPPSSPQRISLDLRRVPLAEALDTIARRTDLRFSYSVDHLPMAQKISIQVEGISAVEAARRMLAQAGLTYHVAPGGQIIPVPAEAAEERQAGRLAGRVTDAQTGQPLPGASVALRAAGRGTATNAEGRFALSGVPAGPDTLVVSYIGYEEETAQVRVEDGAATTQNVALSPAVLEGEEVTVLGLRAQGQARALNLQRSAANIINVVASDQFGRFPDATAPEALQRLPAVSVQRDQGEARYVQIRGGAPQNTLVTFNGVRVPSPEGEQRQIQLDAVPVELIKRIRVTKALTADQDAEALGGSVDLETKKGPSDRLLSVDAAGGYGSIREDPTYKLSATYGDRVGPSERLGVLASVSYEHRDFGSDDVEPVYDFGDGPGLEDDALAEHETRYYDILRERLGATASADYQFSERSTLYVRGVYTQLRDEEYQPNLISILEDGALEYEHKDRLETARTISVAGGGEHLLGERFGLSYDLSWARSVEDTPRENELLFLQEGVSFSPSLGTGDDPEDIQPNPSAVGPMAFDELVQENKYISNTNVVGEADADWPYQIGGAAGVLKFGGKFRHKNADQAVEATEYGLVDGAAPVMLGDDVGGSFSLGDYNPGAYDFPAFAVSPSDIQGFRDRYAGRLEGEKDIEADTEDYDLTEQVAAGYLMTELNVTERLMVLPGLRYEHTLLETQGQSFDAESETLSPVDSESDYGHLFPSLHVRYRLTPNTNLRVAATRAVARPNYFFLVPYRIRDEGDLELGNPDLDPTTATNLDLMVEHYTESIGAYSAGLFYKRLQDPVLTFRDAGTVGGEDFEEVVQPRNGESGRIWGVEVSAQQQLRFLPGALGGLGLYANYTYTQSRSTLLSGRELPFPGQSDHLLNAAVSYERSGFSGQVSLNYTGDFLQEVGEDGSGGRYIDDRVGLDAKASYDFGAGVSAYAEVLNVLNTPLYAYRDIEERPLQREFYERWGWLGVRYNL